MLLAVINNIALNGVYRCMLRIGITALLALNACSAGQYGLLRADVQQVEGARLVAVDTLGADMRTVKADAGVTLGWGRRIYIYPDGTPDLPQPGAYLFAIPLPAEPPLAWDVCSLGLDLRTSSLELGAVFGWRASTVLVHAPADSSLSFRLFFDSTNPGATRLDMRRGDNTAGNERP